MAEVNQGHGSRREDSLREARLTWETEMEGAMEEDNEYEQSIMIYV